MRVAGCVWYDPNLLTEAVLRPVNFKMNFVRLPLLCFTVSYQFKKIKIGIIYVVSISSMACHSLQELGMPSGPSSHIACVLQPN